MRYLTSETIIRNSHLKNLSGVNFDNKLKIEKYIITICQRTNKILHALARMNRYVKLGKRWMLIKTFFSFQFNCCPVIWIFSNRALNNEIFRLYRRCLRVIYKGKNFNIEELLEKDNSVSMRCWSILTLTIEMYKLPNGISSKIMNATFQSSGEPHYNLRHKCDTHSVYHGS